MLVPPALPKPTRLFVYRPSECRHFRPGATLLCAENSSLNKGHSFDTIVYIRKIQIVRERFVIYFTFDSSSALPVNVREGFQKRFGMPSRHSCKSLSGVAEILVSAPECSPRSILIFH